MVVLSVIVVAGVVAGVVIASRKSGPKAPATGSSQSPSTIAGHPETVAQLRTQYLRYINAYADAQTQVSQKLAPISTDIAKQQQRAKNDAATYAADKAGAGCKVNTADPSASSACVGQEAQSATNAQNDEAAANTRLAADRMKSVAVGRIGSNNVNTFVQRLNSIPWTGDLKADAEKLVTGLVQYRAEFDRELTALSKNHTAAVNADASKATVFFTQTQNATQALNTALGVPPPPAES